MTEAPQIFYGIPALGSFLAVLCLIFGWRAGKRQWLLNSLPTSKTTGVFIGVVELKGSAEVENPQVSYLAGIQCVYYHWNVSEHWSRTVQESYTDSKGQTRTRTRTEHGQTVVAQGGEEPPFYLKDDCGIIRVQPAGAAIEGKLVFDQTCGQGDPLYYGRGPQITVPHSDHRRTFTEFAIPLHESLYVMGQARERADIVAPEIAADKRTPIFLISTRSEGQISSGFKQTFWWLFVLGGICGTGSLFVRDLYMQIGLGADLVLLVGSGFMYVFIWLVGCAWILYNNLVELRMRVRQAWANVDVQLKRRNELIPNLVNAVSGLKDYELNVQSSLALLRGQLLATAPGQPGFDFVGCVPKIKAMVEVYPQLKTNESFLNLQKQLSDTEERIALARAYFNDVSSFYNARLESLPDIYIALMAGMEAQALMTADSFERAPIKVQLAQ
ncbi:MAG: LemA family protein [Candidatus Omnitrophica bacterium]|nr:LemA family protein [Candidatus Omnitrophota bacterium]